jgi:transposase
MSRRPRRKFTSEFKAEAVDLVRQSGKSPSQVAKDLDLTETALRGWIKKAQEAGGSPKLAKNEREELATLRQENRTLRMERDFLKKAAAFFAKETA